MQPALAIPSASLTVPGVQGETDVAAAEAFASRSNDWIHGEIKNYPKELGAFGAVSMHNPKQAVVEMTRCNQGVGILRYHGQQLAASRQV